MENIRLKTGFRKFDDNYFGGLCPGISLIKGKPGSGKTTLMLNFIKENIDNLNEVLYCDPEGTLVSPEVQEYMSTNFKVDKNLVKVFSDSILDATAFNLIDATVQKNKQCLFIIDNIDFKAENLEPQGISFYLKNLNSYLIKNNSFLLITQTSLSINDISRSGGVDPNPPIFTSKEDSLFKNKLTVYRTRYHNDKLLMDLNFKKCSGVHKSFSINLDKDISNKDNPMTMSQKMTKVF